jgi:pilus assembly protein CpaB
MKKAWPLLVAAVLGLAAVYMINSYLKEKERSYMERIGELRPVLVATKDISQGAKIDSSMVALRPSPVKFIQPGALTSKSTALGKVAAVNIMAGEQILRTKLTTPEIQSTLSMRIPSGKRAIAISVDEISGVGGMLRPGDHVDVIGIFNVATGPAGQQITETVSVTLFQNVLVLAAGTESQGKTKGKVNIITLALTPHEAGIISFVEQQGELRLVLRPRAETEIQPLAPVSWSSIAQEIFPMAQTPEELPEPPGKQPTIEIFRGLRKETAPVPKIAESEGED